MSRDDPPNPLEELQRRLQDALGGKNVNVSVKPMGFQEGGGGESEPPPGAKKEDPDNEDQEAILQRIRNFSLKPREIRDYLDRFVVKQDEAKKVLSVAICDHYNHVRQCIENPQLAGKDYSKQNIILLGPTGVGKTYLMRNVARLIGVPFVKADATKFSETGYVGADVEDLVRDLNKIANGNSELAQYGIIYIDEIDKIAAAGNATGGRDVSGRGVQINLLKLMEDTEVSLFSPNDMMAQMQAMMSAQGGKKQKRTLSTRHILFIVSGAFDKLAERVKKRLEAGAIGFASAEREIEPDDEQKSTHEFLRRVETTDFIDYGFEPEFVGRLPVRVACEPLYTPDLAQILRSSEGSILEQYRQDFYGYGIDFSMNNEAVEEVAGRAYREKTGARGLMTVLERVFRDFKFELPSTAVKEFAVDFETIRDPSSRLQALLKEHQHMNREVMQESINAFARRFGEEHGLTLEVSAEAAEALMDAATEEEKEVRTICERKFKDYQHGLQLISRNTGCTTFTLTAEMVHAPDKTLSQRIVESFRQAEAQEKTSSGDEGGNPPAS